MYISLIYFELSRQFDHALLKRNFFDDFTRITIIYTSGTLLGWILKEELYKRVLIMTGTIALT